MASMGARVVPTATIRIDVAPPPRPAGRWARTRHCVRSDETSTGRTGVNRFGASVILLALLPASWSWTPVSWPGRARWLGALLARHVSLSLHASVRPPHACGVRARPGIDEPSSCSGGLRTYHDELAIYKEFVNFPIVPAAFVSVRSPDCEL